MMLFASGFRSPILSAGRRVLDLGLGKDVGYLIVSLPNEKIRCTCSICS